LQAIRTVFLFLGAVFALLLILMGVIGYLITGPAPRETGAAPILVDHEAAQSLDNKVEALEQQIALASATGQHTRLTLEITEEEATSKLDELADGGDLPVAMDRIQIHFIDGCLCGFAVADLLIDVQVSLRARIEVDQGKPDIIIESLNIGRLPIPKTLIDQVMNAIMRKTEDRLENIPVELEGVTIEDGVMTISGVTK